MAKKNKGLENNILLKSEVLNELSNGTDRSKVIVGATIIETQLERILEKYLVKNNKIQKDTFSFNGFLGTFSAKINACFMLGLISKELYNDIQRLRGLRNDFAHNLESRSLENEETKEEVHKFKMFKDCFNSDWDKQPTAIIFGIEVSVLYVALIKMTTRIETIPTKEYEIWDLAFDEKDYEYLKGK